MKVATAVVLTFIFLSPGCGDNYHAGRGLANGLQMREQDHYNVMDGDKGGTTTVAPSDSLATKDG